MVALRLRKSHYCFDSINKSMEVFVSPSSLPFPINYSSLVAVRCEGDLHRNSCALNDTEVT